MKRRRRGQPVANPLPAAAALGMAKRLAALAEEVRAATTGMYRARESRDKYKARVRSLEAAVAAERRRSAAVVAEQTAKTAALREEAIGLRRQLADAKEHRDRPATADAAVVGKLRARLADGNAAYAKLTATQEQLRTAFDQAVSQRKATAHVYRSWDRLCLKLCQSTKGQALAEADQRILQQWIGWRNEQHQKKAGQK